MATKILLVEDDLDLGTVLKQYLEASNFNVFWAQNPAELLQNAQILEQHELAVLDIMLPKINGFDLAKEIRKNSSIPFLFLTAKGQSIDRILGLKLGAEDYITKPCEPEELILRINNILKRTRFSISDEIKIGSYHFSPKLLQLKHEKETFKLTEKECELLQFLLHHNHTLVHRKDILENLWGEDDYFMGRSLDVFISRLRKYLRHDPSLKIESVRGVGFKVEF